MHIVWRASSFVPGLKAFLAMTGILMFVIILDSPHKAFQNNEERISAYVWDAVVDGNWACQHDGSGDIASKPPLYTWISSAATLISGQISPFTLYFPSALATVLTTLLLYVAGRKLFGWRAGFLAGFCYLLSYAGQNQMNTARYDALFALCVALTAFAAFSSWEFRQRWIWFWLAAALATLVKGPLGVLLGASGLLAHLWEKRTVGGSTLRGSHAIGVALFLAITGGWFALAYWDIGPALVQKQIFRELFRHSVGQASAEAGGNGTFYEPAATLLADFAPWSLLTLVGIWRLWVQPARDASQRRFERFLACWLITGLALFTLASHQRGRLVYPLIPAAALLAGRELALLVFKFKDSTLFKVSFATAVVTLGGLWFYHHDLREHSKSVEQTSTLKDSAQSLHQVVGAEFPLTMVNAPFSFRFYWNAWRPPETVSVERGLELLSGKDAAFLAVTDLDRLENRLKTNTVPYHVLASWPKSRGKTVTIIGNRPTFDGWETVAADIGHFDLRMKGLQLKQLLGNDFTLTQKDSEGFFQVKNTCNEPKRLRVLVNSAHSHSHFERVLQPHETWELAVGKTTMAQAHPASH